MCQVCKTDTAREIFLIVLCTAKLLSRFSHVRLCATRDGSLSGSTVPGILQARTLEWVAISFSNFTRQGQFALQSGYTNFYYQMLAV